MARRKVDGGMGEGEEEKRKKGEGEREPAREEEKF